MRCMHRWIVFGHYHRVGGVIHSGSCQFRPQTSQSQVFAFPNSAQRFTDVCTLDSEINEDGYTNGSRFPLPEFTTDEVLKRCAWSRGSASSVSAPQFDPSWQCDRAELRAWISTGNQESSLSREFGESPDPEKRESDEEGSRTVGGVGLQQRGKGGEGLLKVKRRKKPYTLRVESIGSEAEGGLLGCGSEEDWGNVPKKAVKKNVVVKMCKAVRASGDGELSACGEENVRLLLALGADEEQVVEVLKKHPELHKERVASSLLESSRLFQDFGMDGRVLLEVIVKLCSSKKWKNMMIRSTPDGLKLVLTFLRDEIGVKDLGKVVTGQPTLLAHSIQAVQKNVNTLESLGVVVDGAFVEKFSCVLLINGESLRKKAQALDLGLGPGIYVKQPLLLCMNAENVSKRVANLNDVVGEALSVRELLVKDPNFLIAEEETVRETWCKLVEMFGKDAIVLRARSSPHILRRNWNTLHPKVEYLKSEGFGAGDILTCLPKIAIASLDDTIKSRVEIALESGRLQAGSVRLSTLLSQSNSEFNKMFGVQL